MANDKKSDSPDEDKPMSTGKAIGVLLLLYALIGGPAIWKVRRNCLLERDDCNYYDLLEWVQSDRLSLIASIIILLLLLTLTWQFIKLARAGKLGIEEDPPEPRFNVSGLVVALIVFVLYLGGSFAILMSAADDFGRIDDERPEITVWKIMGPFYGTALVWTTFWHINDYFVKPVSNIVLILLFSLTFGSLYLFVKSMIWNL